MSIKTKIKKLCEDQSVDLVFSPVTSGLMTGIAKINGNQFIIDPSVNLDSTRTKLTCLVIHELAHLLSVPKKFRGQLKHNLKGVDNIYICEYATRLLSLKICEYLDIDLIYAYDIFSGSNSVDRNHTLESFYLQALNFYHKDRKKALIEL
jgi:hypothetical protein